MTRISDRALAQLVARASTLWERVGDPGLAARASDERRGAARLARWRELAAGGDEVLLQRRLAWDGLTLAEVRQALCATPEAHRDDLPGWALTLRAIIQAASTSLDAPGGAGTAQGAALDTRGPAPFEELFLPALSIAREQLRARLDAAAPWPPPHLSEGAAIALERALLTGLAELCADALYERFQRRRSPGHTMLLALLPTAAPPLSTERYGAFIRAEQANGMRGLFTRYPVLGRLVAGCVERWVATSAELIERLRADYTAIRERLGPNAVSVASPRLDRVAEIRLGRSDSHRGGRSVAIVTWESGLRAVYKPKDVGLEQAFAQLLEWCNTQGAPLQLRAPRVVPRAGYGWVELVEQQPCADAAVAARHFQRAGMLLCLLYVLRANDAHLENVIACGEQLVLIDAETLLQPPGRATPGSGGAQPRRGVTGTLRDSVIRTGLLPAWQFADAPGVAYDLGGLGELDGVQLVQRERYWRDINTDNMWPAERPAIPPLAGHEAVLNGRIVTANEHLEHLVDGFSQMYSFLLRRRRDLLDANSPLTRLEHQQGRYLLRSTSDYARILSASLQPQALRDGVERSIELERLCRALLTATERPAAWPLLAAELHDLERMDIPYLSFDTSRRQVNSEGAPPAQVFLEQSGVGALHAQLRRLCTHDLAHQVRLIRSAFATRGGRLHEQRAGRWVGPRSQARAALLGAQELVDEARIIAARLRADAIPLSDGSVTWVGPCYHPSAQRFQLQYIGESLYDGRCGVAIFLAALDAVTGRDEHRELALAALRPIRGILRRGDPREVHRLVHMAGVGGGFGIGSIMYALALASRLLRAPEIVGKLEPTIALVSPGQVPAPHSPDVLDGTAGMILGLLALYETTQGGAALTQAQAWSRRLPRAGSAEAQTQERPSASFAQGSAGIGYALLRLARRTRSRAHLAAALWQIGAAERIFTEHNTDAGCSEDDPGSWCHGAPGVALAVLAGQALAPKHIAGGAGVGRTLERLVAKGAGLRDDDRLCCGTMGIVETLVAAGQLRAETALGAAAQELAARVIQRARQAEGYALIPGPPATTYNPGLFLGLAGVGYTLLRLVAPRRLPSLLLWQLPGPDA